MPHTPSPNAIHGNIFEALEIEDAPELQARVDLAVALTREVRRIVDLEGIAQREVAERIGLHPTDLSRLMNGSVEEFSQERLQRALRELGCEIEIRVRRPSGGAPPRVRVDASELAAPVSG